MKMINTEEVRFFVPAMSVLGTVSVVAAPIHMLISGKSDGSAFFFSVGIGLLFAAAVLKWIDGKFFS